MTPIVRLSDDEVVAVALARRAAWPTALPSLRKGADDLREAAFRGARSLMLRVDALDEELIDNTAGRVLADHASVVSTPVGGSPDRPGSQLVLHSLADGVVVERITADGVHEFGIVDAAGALDLLLDVVIGSEVPVDVAQLDSATGPVTVVAQPLQDARAGRAALIDLLGSRLSLVRTFAGAAEVAR